MKWTIGTILDWTTQYFNKNNIHNARHEAEILMSFVLNEPRLSLYIKKDECLSEKELSFFKKLITERQKRKPLAYIIGESEFMGLSFKVNNHTLIPRPETELLVEESFGWIKSNRKDIIVDIGTGSGNIAVSIAKLARINKIYAVDISVEALAVAQDNINRHGLANKIILKCGNLFEPLHDEGLKNKVNIIVSNPPYVAENEFSELEPELKFEPEIALQGGKKGLDIYEKLFAGSKEFLTKNGIMIVEMNSLRYIDIINTAEHSGFRVEKIVKDYSGHNRVLVLRNG